MSFCWLKWLKAHLQQAQRVHPQTGRAQRHRPDCEQLEDRFAPAVLTAFEGQPLTDIPLATINDGIGQASDYSATIDWGDGTLSLGTIVNSDQHGVFTVMGSHIYLEDGEIEQDLVDAFPVTVTINHLNAVSATVTDVINVVEELAATASPINNGFEGQPFNNILVATFTGGTGQVSDYSATIDWGDGITSIGTITGPDQNGQCTVTGSHIYLEDGEVEQDLVDQFPVTVTISCLNATPVTVTNTVNIAEELSVKGGLTTNGFEGQPLNDIPVATFTGGTGQVSDYSATIDWGDGTTSIGTIAGPDQNGQCTVMGSHIYLEDGEVEQDLVDQFPVTVTISCLNATPVTVTDVANIGEELSAAGGLTNNGYEGQPLNNIPLATFTGGTGQVSDYSATIDWGDGTTSTGTIIGPFQNGLFFVTGSHVYGEDGEVEQDLVDQFPVGVTISCLNATPVTVTDTANIGEEFSAAPAPPNNGSAGKPLNSLQVETFAGGTGQASNYAATRDWGDGIPSAGTITASNQGVFTVRDSHTAAKSSRPGRSDDTSWQILHQRIGDRISDLNDAAVQELALALQGNGH